MTISAILLLIAVILFVVAAINIPSPKVNLGWAGLAFFAGAFLAEKL
jgi:hypothetical protein